MPAALTLPQISTNVRFAISRFLAPDLAAAGAERLFLTPPPRNAGSAIDLLDARGSAVAYRGRLLGAWSWGPPGAPTVLLAHGWGGYAAQLRGFVQPLARAGYRVVAYDQPAHGVSDGELTGLPDFAGAFAALAEHFGNVRAAIGHSLGATAAAIALARGSVALERLVLISPPSDLIGHSRRFARWHWMPERLRRAMQRAIEERYGLRWDELDVARLAPRLDARALIIHDLRDRQVPWKQGAAFAQHWPKAKLVTTRGLGHARILRDDAVIDAAAAFFICAR
jgi:pimeloyl-ACP methyl ester carboxylesterase